MLREMMSTQRKVRDIHFRIDGTGTASVIAGSAHVTLTDNGTGDYTITLVNAGARLLGAFFTAIDADAFPQIDISDSDETAVNVVFKDDAGGVIDCDFFGHIVVSDAQLET